jgi:hypothetical protein
MRAACTLWNEPGSNQESGQEEACIMCRIIIIIIMLRTEECLKLAQSLKSPMYSELF